MVNGWMVGKQGGTFFCLFIFYSDDFLIVLFYFYFKRKRIQGHDWCIIKLAAPCIIEGVLLDTAFFTGNYVPKVSVQAAYFKEEGNLISGFFLN